MHLTRPAAWIEVTGEDAKPFLQGQSTNDLNRPAPAPVTYTLWLDRKGKVLADSFVLQETEERFLLASYHSRATTILERLEPYIIADDVELRDLTETAISAAIWGKDLPNGLARCGLGLPEGGSFFHRDRLHLFPGRRSRQPNLDLIVTGDDNEKRMAAVSAAILDAGGELVDGVGLERERIESCIPGVPHDIGPRDLPQEGHLELSALSYTKGCYLGQEVMARIRSMGQVRRGLAQVRIFGPDTPIVPSTLYDGAREAGEIRSLAGPAPFLGMAIVKKDVMKKSRHLALSPDGPPSVEIHNVFDL